MSYITSITPQLVSEVIKEAKAIKQHATELERSMLNFRRLNPMKAGLCIYGQMTGDCFGPRATHLLNECAIKPFAKSLKPDPDSYVIELSDKQVFDLSFFREFSAIEVYIAFPDADAGGLIDFIKGSGDTLILNNP